jgi:primosomal protein N' (replication factor Y)
MLAKGFDFPDVSVVGVLAADSMFNLPDFRAAERAMQLLIQVGGRSGRGDTPGTVVIQTYDPDHPVMEYVVDHDYAGFYESEIEERRALLYPPFAHLVRVVSWAEQEGAALALSETARRSVEEYLEKSGTTGVEILGPAPCPISRMRAQYRFGLILKAPELDLLLPVAQNIIIESRTGTGRLEVDVDPLILM